MPSSVAITGSRSRSPSTSALIAGCSSRPPLRITADSDGDRLTDYYEYLALTSPFNADTGATGTTDDQKAAADGSGAELYERRGRLLELTEDETFLCDLVGLRGVDDEGREIGVLADVLQPGGNDVYIFKGPRGEVLVPALKSACSWGDSC